MTAPSRDYLAVHHPAGTEENLARATAALAGSGWKARHALPFLTLFLPEASMLPAKIIGPDTVIVGRYTGRLAPDHEALLVQGWGRYVAISGERARARVMRDPSGGLEAVWWRRGDLSCFASTLENMPCELLPADLAIDFEVLASILRSSTVCQARVPLSGIATVQPGQSLRIDPVGATSRQLWRPADFANRGADPSPEAFKAVVDDAVTAVLAPHQTFVGEISGGFDSAVVASAAVVAGRGIQSRWLNFYGDEAEGDERYYATDVARRYGLRLECGRKVPKGLGPGHFGPLATGMRPALQGLDVEYERAVTDALSLDGATGLLTGQGGDAVFFQSGSAALVIDRTRLQGLRSITPSYLHRTARWTRVPAWALAQIAVREKLGLRQSDKLELAPEHPKDAHPWQSDLEGVSPAKRGQIRQLVHCQIFWGDCLRVRAAEPLHPLLSQPVMEHGLGVSADALTQGSVDRALAREAFADRLPSSILSRRGKGELTTYYGHVVRGSLPYLRELLIDGALMRAGVIEQRETEALLDPDVLIWSGVYNVVLIQALLETWARHWTDRLAEHSETLVRPVKAA